MIGAYQVRPSVRDGYDPWACSSVACIDLRVKLHRLRALILEHAVVVIEIPSHRYTPMKDQWCVFCQARLSLDSDRRFEHRDFCTVLKLKEENFNDA